MNVKRATGALLTAFALVALTSHAAPARAQNAAALQTALRSYLQQRSGVHEHVTIVDSHRAVASCPPGRRCTGSTAWVLAAYRTTGHDAGGQALFVNAARCPNCFHVITARDGVLSVADLEHAGVDAASARALAGCGRGTRSTPRP